MGARFCGEFTCISVPFILHAATRNAGLLFCLSLYFYDLPITHKTKCVKFVIGLWSRICAFSECESRGMVVVIMIVQCI